jgi:glycosyltransferase involved in cell wall biosynthesis
MKLLFLNLSPVRFTVETPEQAPLGGSESCCAYLARQLAANGHDVTLMTDAPQDVQGRLMGVRHLPADAGTGLFFREEDFDAIITLTSPGNAESLQRAAPRSLHVAWLHLMPPQPVMADLSPATPFIDCAVMVSEYQRQVLRFGGPSQAIGNGMAPPFENMFGSAAELRAAKENRAVYASVPDRGLDVLAEAFARAKIETRLDIYSGMNLYQRHQDDVMLAPLYDAVEKLPRTRRHLAVSQRELAAAMRGAAFLAYPCILAETYCIVALEAMAAGLKVVATDAGALPESTLGHAALLPLAGLDAQTLAPRFAEHLEKNVGDFLARTEAWAEERFAQVQDVNRNCTWTARAKEWEAFLGPAVAWKRSQP